MLTLAAADRLFVDRTYLWLIEQFGTARLMSEPFLLPTPANFPYTDLEDPGQFERLLQQFCKHIGLRREKIAIEIFDDTAYRKWGGGDDNPLGTYQEQSGWSDKQFLVRLGRSSFGDKQTLMVVLAHELMHAHLLGKGYIVAEENPDHEKVNDLALAFFGFGIMQSNAGVVVKQFKSGVVGYLTPEMLGYANALNCYLARSDSKVAEHFISRNFYVEPFREAVRYLTLGGETAVPRAELEIAGRQQVIRKRMKDLRTAQDLDRQIEACSQLIRMEPRNPEGWSSRGYCHLRKGDFKAAFDDYDKALQYAPKDATLFTRRGACLTGLGKIDRAKKDIDTALQLDPKNALAWRDLGVWHLQQQQLNDAFGMFVKAQQLNSQAELVHYYLGLIHLKRGSKLSAEWEFETSRRNQETILEQYPAI